MHIYVDADAFPNAVKEILLRAVLRLQVQTTFVACQYVKVPESEFIKSLEVTTGPDSADDCIAEWAEPGDLVITADIPLADRVVEKGAHALDPRGMFFTMENIKHRLAMRDLMDELRTSGEIIGGGPPAFNKKDVRAFADQLDRFLTKYCKL